MIVENLKPVNSGALVCTFNLKLPKWNNFVIRDCSYFVKGDKSWISFPSRKYESEGKTKYYEYNAFEDRSNGDKFKQEVMNVLSQHLTSAQ